MTSDPYVIPLSLDGIECLIFDADTCRGWGTYHSGLTDRLGADVLLRIAPVDVGGALDVHEIRVTGFDSLLMRAIPFTRIEAAVNQPQHRAYLLGRIGTDNRGAPRPARAGVATPIQPRSLVLADPGGYRKPDSFYASFADLYLWLAALSPRPAHELAGANNMPVATVHRWIREAKARGVLLLPAHRSGDGEA